MEVEGEGVVSEALVSNGETQSEAERVAEIELVRSKDSIKKYIYTYTVYIYIYIYYSFTDENSLYLFLYGITMEA